MIKYDQTRFGGKDAPIKDQGNCFQACVATVLQIPIEEAFDCTGIQEDSKWFDGFNYWLEQYGLGCVFVITTPGETDPCTKVRGIHMAECMSTTLYGGERHVVVIQDGYLLHDPNPNAKEQGACQGYYIFVSIEAYKLVRS